MKNLKLNLIVNLLLSFSILSNANALPKPDDEIRASIIKTDKESLVVHVNKDTHERVRVEIKDETGNIIYSKKILQNVFSEKYDFSKIADGTYTILVSNESGVLASKKFVIFTSREIAMR